MKKEFRGPGKGIKPVIGYNYKKWNANYTKFTVYDVIYNYWRNHEQYPTEGLDSLVKRLYKKKIADLTKSGYRENVRADITFGDHDMIVIDHERKEWCWWENGFWPFSVRGDLPTTRTLQYWSDKRQ